MVQKSIKETLDKEITLEDIKRLDQMKKLSDAERQVLFILGKENKLVTGISMVSMMFAIPLLTFALVPSRQGIIIGGVLFLIQAGVLFTTYGYFFLMQRLINKKIYAEEKKILKRLGWRKE